MPWAICLENIDMANALSRLGDLKRFYHQYSGHALATGILTNESNAAVFKKASS